MKRNTLKFSMLALGVMAGGLLSSCSNENEPTINGNTGSMLVKAPNVVAYSGDHIWNNVATRGVDVNANMWAETWDCPPDVDELTAEDIAAIKALLEIGHQTKNDIVLPFENYWVQQVYKGEDSYHSHDRCTQAGCNHENSEMVTGSDKMEHLQAYDGNPWGTIWDAEARSNVSHPYGHINNFNFGTNNNYPGTCSCGKSHSKTTLMVNMPTEGFGPDEQFGFDETYGTAPKFYNNYIVVEYKGYYYVGFDYEAHKNDQTTHNHNEGMDVERDWNFTDWIVRITPAYHKGTTPDENPGGIVDPTPNPTPDPVEPDPVDPTPKCDKCGHPSHDGNCPDCNEGEVCNPKDEPQNPGDENVGDIVKKGLDEVEINLALDKKEDENILESHLSIHVRTATDVEVFIPVPAKYYCDADDMAIVEQHFEEVMVHGGPTQVSYNINGNVVTLNVEFQADGIRIWTDGINQDVIDYCWNTYGDGITFEIWNYFNDPETGLPNLSTEELKYLLNKATVKFLDKIPGQYINAFTEGDGFNGKYDENTNQDGFDFHVTPEHYQDNFYEPEEGVHFNGCSNNEIYKSKN